MVEEKVESKELIIFNQDANPPPPSGVKFSSISNPIGISGTK